MESPRDAIGREERATDTVTAALVERFGATLGIAPPARAGRARGSATCRKVRGSPWPSVRDTSTRQTDCWRKAARHSR